MARNNSLIRTACPLAEAARQFPDDTAILHGPLTISFSQLNHLVNAGAAQLEKSGVSEGQRVVLAQPPEPDTIVILWALWRLGATACLLNTRFPAETLNRQILSLDADAVFVSEHFSLNSALPDVRQLAWEQFNTLNAPSAAPSRTDIDPSRPATILFTSGSSSAPKAAVHNLAAHLANAAGSLKHIPFRPGDRWLLTLPLYHVSGLSLLFRSVTGGGGLVIPSLQEDLTRSVERYQITHLSLVSTQLARIFQNPHNLERIISLKTILLGGGPAAHELFSEAERWGLPLYITYGLTETASQAATTDRLQRNEAPAARVLEHAQIRIKDDGEILVKGPALFLGYWQDGKIVSPLDADGWYATGDLGTLDQDGKLTVTGRKDFMFVSGGENIQPEEIEKELVAMEGIDQAVVVPATDKTFGFRPVAFLKEDGTSALNTTKIQEHLRQILPGFKVPVFFYRWPKHLRPAALKIPRQIFTNLIQEHPDKLEEYN